MWMQPTQRKMLRGEYEIEQSLGPWVHARGKIEGILGVETGLNG
jgi:hypothetical protein